MACVVPAYGQTVPVPVVLDSVVHETTTVVPAAVGAGLIVAGAAGHAASSHSWSFAKASAEAEHTPVADVLQYAPLAFPWVMKAAGSPTRSGWGRMAVSQGAATLLMAGTVYGLKHAVDSPRPDGTDNRSFPSGHTVWAFMGATVTARELGWRSPWYTVGAYTLATGIAVERVIDNRHFPTDVVAGAGIGILSAQLGYFIGDLIFRNSQLDDRVVRELTENNNLSFMSLHIGMGVPLNSAAIADGKIIRMPTLMAGISSGFPVSDHWGLRVDVGLQSTPLQIEQNLERTHVANLNALGAVVSPYYRLPLSRRVSLSADAGAGYYFNFGLNSIDKAVKASSGTPIGRIDVGTEVRFDEHFRCKASVGYELSGYRYEVRPSDAYLVERAGRTSGAQSTLLLNVSSVVTF